MTIPSQIRYVLYTEQVVHSGLTFLTAPERRLVHVIMYTIPAFDSTGGCSEGVWLGVGGTAMWAQALPHSPLQILSSESFAMVMSCSLLE